MPNNLEKITLGQTRTTGHTTANWQAAEADLVSIGSAGVDNKVHSLFIDITGIAGTLTVRMYHTIAGIERQVYSQNFTVAADGPGRWSINGTVGIYGVLRVTLQSNNAADNGVDVDYDYILEDM